MAKKLEVEIVGDARSLHKALDESGSRTSKFGGLLSTLKTGAIGAGAALAGGLVVGLEKSIHAAIEAQVVNTRLNAAFRNAGLSAKKYAEQVDKLESSGRRLGFTDEQTKTSLGSLITATGNMKDATHALGIAQDLARFKSVDLTQATKALTMAHAGSQRALKQLGLSVQAVTTAQDNAKRSYHEAKAAIDAQFPSLSKMTDAQKLHKAALEEDLGVQYAADKAQAQIKDHQATYQNVLEATTKAVHGQADAYSKTAAGAMEQFRAQISHLEVEIGEKLLPVIVQAIQWITVHWPEITKTVQDSWNQIRPTLVALIDFVKAVVQTIRDNWATIGPIVRDVTEIIKAQIAIITGIIKIFADLLRGDWSAAWNDAKGVVGAFGREIVAYIDMAKRLVIAALRGLITELGALAGAFLDAAKSLGLAIAHGIISGVEALPGLILNALQSAIDYAVHHIDVPSLGEILGIGGGTAKPANKLPRHAAGARNVAGGLALVGERGPELVNLPRGSDVIPNSQLGGQMVVNLVLDGKIAAQALIDPLRGEARIYKQQTGKAAFA